ncbi:MAG: 4Fe-4S binding protein [Desulfobacter sp.]|nr:MAG: 4Fe-4S binding protein [Desulfobacter sp.]
MKKKYWKRLRQTSQLACLFVFLMLFRLTEYSGSDKIDLAVNLWFRLDPLVGVCVTLATRTLIVLLWPCVLVLGLTMVFGRWFCGWVCPLGTLTDIAARVIRPKYSPMAFSAWRHLKYGILIFLVLSSVFSVQFLGFFDPFALLVRAMAFSLDPVFNFLVTSGFNQIYLSGPAWLSQLTEPVFDLFKAYLLPHKQSFYYLSLVSFCLLAGILGLEFLGRRFWCRTICPLGALLGLAASTSILKRMPPKTCKGCGLCNTLCPMGSFDKENQFLGQECHLYTNCLAYCPQQITRFRLGPARPVDLSRRKILGAAVMGVTVPVMTRLGAGPGKSDLIRPPGALDERDFLAVCVRCGECMKVCITQGLQPLGLDTGLDAMFTPVLVPRIGHCEFNCTLCSSVCPTQAIKGLSRPEKQAHVMGKAFFDKNRCLPWVDGQDCLVCEEHCPTHNKAILFKAVQIAARSGQTRKLKQPYVIADRCIGCGICEHVCPVPGEAAIRVRGRNTSGGRRAIQGSESDGGYPPGPSLY